MKSSTSRKINSTTDLKSSKAGSGFSSSCLSGLRSLWATSQTEETGTNREMLVKTTLRELVIYIVYLVVLFVIAIGMISETLYNYTKGMSDLFLESKVGSGTNFKEINNIDDFWSYAQGPLLAGLYSESYYNNMSIRHNEHRLLGVPRIRQLKVRNDSCHFVCWGKSIHGGFANHITECFESYSESVEDKKPFDMSQKEPDNSAWRYFSQSELNGGPHWGNLSTYSGGGYYADLNTTREASEAIIQNLFTNLWLRRGTLAVFIDFTVYNANINLICVVRLLVEFPATGGAIPSWTIRTVRLLRYVTEWDNFVLACEIIFCIFTLYYMVEEILKIKNLKLSYFRNSWNILELVMTHIFLLCMGFNIYRTVEVNKKLTGLLENPSMFVDFEIIFWETIFNNVLAVTVFIAWIKIVKHISYNKTITLLIYILWCCAKGLAGFFVRCTIFIVAFTPLGCGLFHAYVEGFSSLQNSFCTLYRMILADFDFNQLVKANPVLGPIFIMLFAFCVFFALITMFIDIISSIYSEVKLDMANNKNMFETADYSKKVKVKKLNIKRAKIGDRQKAQQTAETNQNKQDDFDKRLRDREAWNYIYEIEAVFAKYDYDHNRVLSEDELDCLLADLAALENVDEDVDVKSRHPGTAQRSHSLISSNDDNGYPSYEELIFLSKSVANVQRLLESIVSSNDALLVRLEALERDSMKEDVLGRILERMIEPGWFGHGVRQEHRPHPQLG